ncbi:MAG: hypothetical protein ABFS45_18540 [Pseudomonadota bacterium]
MGINSVLERPAIMMSHPCREWDIGNTDHIGERGVGSVCLVGVVPGDSGEDMKQRGLGYG